MEPGDPEFRERLGLKRNIEVEFREIPNDQGVDLPGPLFDIYNEDGERIGYVALNFNPHNPHDLSQHRPEDVTILNMDIHFISDGKFSNQGYGKLIYLKIQDMLKSQGKRLVSSGVETAPGLRVWESLEKRGLAKKDPNKDRFDHAWYKMI